MGGSIMRQRYRFMCRLVGLALVGASLVNLASLVTLASAWAGPPPRVALAETYDASVPVTKYRVSEKFDGVRGYWTGTVMLTRSGNVIDLPDWFTADWPDRALDGELWAGRGRFSLASTIVRTAEPDDSAWHRISYQVFDLPEHAGDFMSRQQALARIVQQIDRPWVQHVEQHRIDSRAQLMTRLARVVERGGEGLILRRIDQGYVAGRDDGFIKLKPFDDAEARVIAINPGAGRLEGMMGSLEVRTPAGREFAIGTGFSDAERRDPPAVGDWITYGYTGRTATGLPRFARFLHERADGPPPDGPPAE